MIRLLSVIVGGVVVLMAAQAGLAFMTPPGPAPGAGVLLPALLSNALTVAMLVVLARRMDGTALRRGLLLWAIWGGIQADSMSELLIFDVGIARTQAAWLIAFSLAVAAAAAAFVGWAAPTLANTAAPDAVPVRPWWLVAAPPFYIVCYFVAGVAVWPFVADYYLHQSHPMPTVQMVLAVQVFRGLGFGAIVLLIAHVCAGSRLERAVLAGLTLAVLGGVAPLVMPNPLMPTAIRMAHLFEVAPSIFIFGAGIAWALTRRRPALARRDLATQP